MGNFSGKGLVAGAGSIAPQRLGSPSYNPANEWGSGARGVGAV